jgi:cytochrome c
MRSVMFSIRACVVRFRTRVSLLLLCFLVTLLIAGSFCFRNVTAQASATPTPDRLAQPTLPPIPSQADFGAQVYWLSCLPCHGDKGQGLTEEFRQTYPPEDRNCWESGCHGERPYEGGFQLPRNVPALIGKGTIEKFSNAATLQAYIRAAMPYWKPGSLSEEDAWRVTAFLLRENGFWDGSMELNSQNAARIVFHASTSQNEKSTWKDKNYWRVLLVAGVFAFFLLCRRVCRK